MAVLPATGSEIVMGRVKAAYTNVAAGAGQNISLSGTLGAFRGQSAGTQPVSYTHLTLPTILRV